MSSVKLVHRSKSVGRNEMPFGSDTHVVAGTIVLDRDPNHLWEGEILGVGTPVSSDAAYHQITLTIIESLLLEDSA